MNLQFLSIFPVLQILTDIVEMLKYQNIDGKSPSKKTLPHIHNVT